jgi:hypothetical protein
MSLPPLPILVLLLAGLAPSVATAEDLVIPRFADETATSGIDSVYAGDWEYMVGGGVASFDCDDDGFPDLFLAGGEGTSRLYRNRSAKAGPLAFEAAESGLEVTGATGAYPLDVDGDGRQDLIVLRVGESLAMRGLGGCRFERANEAWGFDGGDAWATAFSATFERGRSWPTIAVGTYIDLDAGAMPWGSCTDNRLQRPAADGRRFAPPIALTPSYCTLSMLFTDWSRSGVPDLRVSNDREYYKGGQEQMWHVPPGGPPRLYTEAEGWKYLRIWGMGIASRDLDGDRYPEYFLTSMSDNKLQVLAEVPQSGGPRPSYQDVAYARKAAAYRPYTGGDFRPSTAWHAEFEDVNNDRLADLFIAKGNVAEMEDFAAKDPNDLLLLQPDGDFRQVGDVAGVASMAIARGATLTDFNLDGLPDLVVTNRWTKAEVYRNVTEKAGAFVAIRPVQDGPNRDAVGGWLEVRCGEKIMRQEITVGGGHAGGRTGWRHFGLGAADAAEARMIWPDGTVGDWQAVTAGSFAVLARGEPLEVWSPVR